MALLVRQDESVPVHQHATILWLQGNLHAVSDFFGLPQRQKWDLNNSAIETLCLGMINTRFFFTICTQVDNAKTAVWLEGVFMDLTDRNRNEANEPLITGQRNCNNKHR